VSCYTGDVDATYLGTSDFIDAVIKTLKHDKLKVLSTFSKCDVWEPGKDFIKNLKPSPKKARIAVKQIKANGVKGTFNHIKTSTIESLKNINSTKTQSANWIKSFGDQFQKIQSSEERKRFILEHVCYLVSLSAGVYLGYHTPDKDWSIGRHRDIFFHSALSAAAIVTTLKLVSRFFDQVEQNMPKQSEEMWLVEFIKKNLRLAGIGGAIGVSTHLFIDGTIQGTKSVMMPGRGTFFYGTLLDDNAWLLANAVLSAKIAAGEFKS